MMHPVFQLIFRSQASENLCYSDLHDMLENCRRHHRELGVTGVMLHCDGIFVQIIEGDEAAVMEAMSRLIVDRRHRRVQVLLERESDRHFFLGWSMAFHDGDLSSTDECDLVEKIFALTGQEQLDEKALVSNLHSLSVRLSV